jgi:hypothetical protein
MFYQETVGAVWLGGTSTYVQTLGGNNQILYGELPGG